MSLLQACYKIRTPNIKVAKHPSEQESIRPKPHDNSGKTSTRKEGRQSIRQTTARQEVDEEKRRQTQKPELTKESKQPSPGPTIAGTRPKGPAYGNNSISIQQRLPGRRLKEGVSSSDQSNQGFQPEDTARGGKWGGIDDFKNVNGVRGRRRRWPASRPKGFCFRPTLSPKPNKPSERHRRAEERRTASNPPARASPRRRCTHPGIRPIPPPRHQPTRQRGEGPPRGGAATKQDAPAREPWRRRRRRRPGP
ncbi:hypothetical protein C2845_PM02G01650 [Panicum miliaceum]|uniref:Uncharacterized protein n=1 Tax=Panicum miliaceum TaxID=4540 RepID=A0A3L6SHW8_PANMI|nr:hypothetical protein C2845_PM02G01650 [Panicum miliaceum]